MTYKPKFLDISQVKLSDDIENLIEQLALHSHEIWAQRRIDQGWEWGAKRDDTAKRHPCLVPFDELDNSEQQYDRNSAAETLKAILALGYLIVPSPTRKRAAARSEAIFLTAADELLTQLRTAQQSSAHDSSLELSVLLMVWNSRRDEDRAWSCQPELYRHLGRRFLKLGEAPLAREVAQTALEICDANEQDLCTTLRALSILESMDAWSC